MNIWLWAWVLGNKTKNWNTCTSIETPSSFSYAQLHCFILDSSPMWNGHLLCWVPSVRQLEVLGPDLVFSLHSYSLLWYRSTISCHSCQKSVLLHAAHHPSPSSPTLVFTVWFLTLFFSFLTARHNFLLFLRCIFTKVSPACPKGSTVSYSMSIGAIGSSCVQQDRSQRL